MKNIPVDTSRIRVLAAGPASPATNQDGTARTNREGRPLINLPVLVLVTGSRPEAASIRLPGPVPTNAELTPLRFVGLTAWYWKLDNGRSGLSLTATEVHPEQAPRAQSASSGR